MAVPLPEFMVEKAGRTRKESYLFDIPFFLAQHGYEIVIPEAVALVGDVFRNGESRQKYFRSGNARLPLRRTENLLQQVYRHPGNIYIAPAHAADTSPSAVYTGLVWGVVQKFEGHSFLISKKLMKIDCDYPAARRQGYAAEAISQLIRHMEGPSVPVFCLTESLAPAMKIEKAGRDFPVVMLSLSELYDGLQHEGLLAEVGIADVSFRKIFEHGDRILRLEGMRNGWTSFAEGQPNMAFRESLSGLKAEINPPPLGLDENIIPGDSAREAFDRRFPGFAKRYALGLNKPGN
jgi:hypothetical protein